MRPIVFVDFDGVLILDYQSRKPVTVWEIYPFATEAVASLNLITEETGAAIVISSAWRQGTPFANIIGHFKDQGITGNVIDVTPIDEELEHRGEEISQWLLDSVHDGPFVILDDDQLAGSLPHLDPHFVQTYFSTGLQLEHAEMAIQILKANE